MADKTFEAATRTLSSLIVTGRAGQKSDTPQQVVESCKILGVDLAALRCVHIAGTKGKGSTSSFTERILRQAGYKTGLYTSPHLVDVRERFRIGGKVLQEDRFTIHFWHVYDTLTSAGEDLHFFHFLTVLGFYIFQAEGVEAAVVEVGMGGRLDATNALPSPVVCGITLLDMDHVAMLGDTLEKIAREKAGIMKAGVPCVSTRGQRDDALAALTEVASHRPCPFFVTPPLPRSSTLSLSAEYQYDNAALALTLARYFAAACPPPPSSPGLDWGRQCASLKGANPPPAEGGFFGGGVEEEGLGGARWPGRAQTLERPRGSARILLDGAHTVESLKSATAWFDRTAEVAREGTGAGAGRRVRVLLFNTTGQRIGGELLSPLVGTFNANRWDLVLFTPNDSSVSSVTKDDGVGLDYTWQFSLLEAWIEAGGGGKEAKGGGGEGKGAVLTAQGLKSSSAGGTVEYVLSAAGSCRVVATIRDAIEVADHLQEALGASGGAVDLCVTGSLYLVGDVLSRACKDDLSGVLDI